MLLVFVLLTFAQVTVLRGILDETYGLERLAIACSLPHVLLMWRWVVTMILVSFVTNKSG